MFEWLQQYWLAVCFSGITGVITMIARKAYSGWSSKYRNLISDIENEKIEQGSIKEGVVALLHDRLIQACQYHMRKDYVTVDELENLKYLYDSYAGLGGNGTVSKLYDRCKRLRIVAGKN